MKKNILLLINGFGIEKAGSYNVYSAELMPNLERIRTSKIFFSIPNKYLDYKSAYRNFSIGINNPLTYNLIENNINSNEYKNNQLLKYITNELNKNKSKLHLFVYWDSDKTIEYLNLYLKEIVAQTSQKIYIHIILCHKSMTDYKDIERGFNALSYELGTNNIKIGLVTGENNLTNTLALKELVKAYITEYGEKWKDVSKRFATNIDTKIAPCDTRTFEVNIGYRPEKNDQIFFFNFSNSNITMFMNEVVNQKYMKFSLDDVMLYSLFPIKFENKKVPFMYNYAVSANYALNSLKSIKAQALVIDKKERCSYINYYMTGLRNNIDEDLKYLPADDEFMFDGDKLLEKINKYDRQLYIINYEIESTKTLEELKTRLNNIDKMIGVLDKYTTDNNWGFFISSLYGVEKEVLNEKLERCVINFSGKSPVFISDKDISLANYTTIEPGSLYELSNTLFWNIDKSFESSGLLKKKSGLLSFLYKKPKGGK